MSDNTPVPVGVPQTPHKAVIAAALAGIAALVASLAAGSPDTVVEWVVIVGSAVVAGGSTYAVPNRAKDEAGVGEGRFIFLVAAGVILALVVWWLIGALDDGKRGDDSRHGNDWEQHPAGSVA